MRKGWSDALYDVVKPLIVCNLSFDWHKCSPPKAKTTFQTSTTCTFSTCTKYKLISNQAIAPPFDDINVRIVPAGPVNHLEGETHRRFVRGENRLAISEELLANAPSTVKQMKLAAADIRLLKAGNLNDV